ncbi:zinc-binding dehydrogenase [Bradyrhizobium sp. CB82]|uniref:zinc-binding dehydrogenase n=1 Tax=Bradyrhizobium sp. CB82 TaxID=3039159 RepID=UPI0024B24C0E|nr:zinc-binding dehydrogenase [Bradyrhizobium sp. CB82]WFU38692.1 zinc-binding dehydrogenase [Bradyrhizobium sp. CB82]
MCSLPALLTPAGIQGIGYSNDNIGGYAEAMLFSEPLLLEVPNGLAAEHAALTEPLAVGVHAVAKANVRGGEVPLVIGCGPVGLAVIAALRIKGLRPIVAADYSPARRALAAKLGADIVIDSRASQPYAAWAEHAQNRPRQSRGAHQDHRAAVEVGKPSLRGAKRRSNPDRIRGNTSGLLRLARNDGRELPYTGSAIEYFTWLSAKLDSIEAMPSSRVSLFFRNAS